MRSLAALIELAEMLIPRVTIIKPIAAKAAAARPPCDPDAIQSLMISMGFHMTSPYAVSAAAAVKMPSRPTIAMNRLISKNGVGKWSSELTKDNGDNDGLDILCARFVGVS